MDRTQDMVFGEVAQQSGGNDNPRAIERLRAANHTVVIPGPISGECLSDPLNIEALSWNGLTRRARNKKIIQDVCAKHGVSYACVMSKRRDHNIVDARHEAIALMHKANPDFSLPRLGLIFGRDHSTILFALQRHGKVKRNGAPYRKNRSSKRAVKVGVFATTEGETAHENS